MSLKEILISTWYWLYRENSQYTLNTDARDEIIVYVLLREHWNGSDYPAGYWFRTLTEKGQKLATTHREVFGCYMGCNTFCSLFRKKPTSWFKLIMKNSDAFLPELRLPASWNDSHLDCQTLHLIYSTARVWKLSCWWAIFTEHKGLRLHIIWRWGPSPRLILEILLMCALTGRTAIGKKRRNLKRSLSPSSRRIALWQVSRTAKGGNTDIVQM